MPVLPLTPAWITLPAEATEAMIEAYFAECERHGFMAFINATTALSAMVASRPTLTDDQVDAMARAHHEANHPASESPIGGYTRWATWEQVCEMPGERDRRIAIMRAALKALETV